MLWTGVVALRLSVVSTALVTVGFDVDWAWLRAGVVAGMLATAAGVSLKLRAERQHRARLTRVLSDTLRQPPGAIPVPRRAR